MTEQDMPASVARMAAAAKRLRAVLRPADDVEEFCLELLSQVVRVQHIETLADMAERISR